jgi:hypothetical protein
MFCDSVALETTGKEMKDKHEHSLSLWESRALGLGEGPPRPLPRPTLPQAGGLQK